MLLLITVIVAMSSILYELAFAQVLSSIIGGTITQYILTIGFYVSFLGFGSLFHGKISQKFKNQYIFFIIIEILLIVISVSSPFFILKVSDFNITLIYILSYTIISAIGFLSGLELPTLMDLYNNKINSYSGKILAYDFFGTFLGTIIFPLVLIPNFNILYIPIIIALFNLFAIGLTIIKGNKNV